MTAGNNIEVGTFTFLQAKAKCAALVASGCVGFTFRATEAEPAAGERMTVYFKSSANAGASPDWQSYLVAQ